MKKFFGSLAEWITIVSGFAVTLAGMLITVKFKIPLCILSIVLILSIIIIWRMWIVIFDLKKKVIQPIKIKQIYVIESTLNHIDILDEYNMLNTNSYITILMEKDDFFDYVGTAYITDKVSKTNLKRAVVVHTSKELDCNQLENAFVVNKLTVSFAIQNEYVNHLKDEENNKWNIL